MELTFKIYYKEYFRQDMSAFVRQIPIKGNKHYDMQNFNIQYFFLTPNYQYLDIVPANRQGYFAVALFWTILIDQVCYSKFQFAYDNFLSKTMYPKFIGNCTAPSLMSSECGHNQHPSKVLLAINDYFDKGNSFDFDREIFKKDEVGAKREKIYFDEIFEKSKSVVMEEIKDYFEKHQPEINWEEFWRECVVEI